MGSNHFSSCHWPPMLSCQSSDCMSLVLAPQQGYSWHVNLCLLTGTQPPLSSHSNDDIVAAVKLAVKQHKAATQGYTPDDAGSHSLHAGRAMALFQQGVDATTIMKLGHWTSTTFMSYIHEQVDIISKGAAQKMSADSTFTNLAVNPPLNFFWSAVGFPYHW